MMRNVLFFVPLLAAAVFAGCTQSESVSDEDFLESVRAKAETAAPTYDSHTALSVGNTIPKIEFETDRVFMYDIPPDGIGEARVTIYNRGEGTLEITNVATSCSCTQGRIDDRIVEPGGQTELIVTVDPKLVPGFDATRMLTISSTDPNMSNFGLPVTAYIQPELELIPATLNLGAFQVGKGFDRQYIVRPLIDEPIEIFSARSTQQYIEASLEPRPETEWAKPGQREYEVTLHIKPDAPVGRLDSKLVLETDLKRTNRLMFDVTGVIHALPYSTAPRSTVYSNVSPGTTLADAFRIVTESPVSVVSTESGGDELELVSRQGENKNELMFDIVVGPEVTSPKITQVWNVELEIAGKTYIEQVATQVTTTVAVADVE